MHPHRRKLTSLVRMLQGLTLAYVVLAILTFAELFKVSAPTCEVDAENLPCLLCFIRPSHFLHKLDIAAILQVNLVKVPSYGRDATKGLATALSMSFSLPPNLVLFLWMLLTKCEAPHSPTSFDLLCKLPLRCASVP